MTRATWLIFVLALACGPTSVRRTNDNMVPPTGEPPENPPVRADPAALRGSRSCDPFAASEVQGSEVDWSKWAGCECVQPAEGRARDRQHCGLFPCAADGCYVKACVADTDCALGLCSAHASRPHGYCVTDDPK